MWNIPTQERLEKIPKLYETEKIPLKEKDVYLHFFIGGCDWYIVEYDKKNEIFFGYAIINGDFMNAEWGYISFIELRNLNMAGCIEVDCESETWFPIQKAIEIDNICRGNNW